jgi:hypothetical protein
MQFLVIAGVAHCRIRLGHGTAVGVAAAREGGYYSWPGEGAGPSVRLRERMTIRSRSIADHGATHASVR